MGQVVVGGATKRSDGEQMARGASALEEASSLPLGCAAPDAMVNAIIEGVIETFRGHRAGGTDALGDLDSDAIARKERGGGLVLAVAVIHPGGGGFHDRDGREGGRKTG